MLCYSLMKTECSLLNLSTEVLPFFDNVLAISEANTLSAITSWTVAYRRLRCKGVCFHVPVGLLECGLAYRGSSIEESVQYLVESVPSGSCIRFGVGFLAAGSCGPPGALNAHLPSTAAPQPADKGDAGSREMCTAQVEQGSRVCCLGLMSLMPPTTVGPSSAPHYLAGPLCPLVEKEAPCRCSRKRTP